MSTDNALTCAVQFPKGGTIQVNWWGNNVWKNSMYFQHHCHAYVLTRSKF